MKGNSRFSKFMFDLFFSIEAACAAHPTADVFINFASFRRLVFMAVLFESRTILLHVITRIV